MAEQRSGQDEPETELIPAVETGAGLASTRQLPAVQDEPAPAAPPEPISAPPLPATPMVLPPAAPIPEAPDAPDAPDAPEAPDAGDEVVVRRRSGRSPLLSGAVGALVAVLVAVIAVAVWKVVPHGGGGAGASSGGSAKALTAQISSFDPSGGSGFRHDGKDWVTQTYRTADFGNLKKGVGLVLDLGSAHAVDRVRLTGNGATVQLRAADSKSRLDDGFVAAGDATVASGSTTLDGGRGGRHRYWMVWVSRLGSGDGGFSARIGDLAVRGK